MQDSLPVLPQIQEIGEITSQLQHIVAVSTYAPQESTKPNIHAVSAHCLH